MQKANKKPRPFLYSVLGAALILLFWNDLNRARGEQEPILFKFFNEEQGEKTPDVDNQQSGAVAAPINRKYQDGTYTASAQTPWGTAEVQTTIQDGQWKDVQFVQIPDSPPSYYAARKLTQQALNAQNATWARRRLSLAHS